MRNLRSLMLPGVAWFGLESRLAELVDLGILFSQWLAAAHVGLLRVLQGFGWRLEGKEGGRARGKGKRSRFGCGSKPMVPFWGRCTTHFSQF